MKNKELWAYLNADGEFEQNVEEAVKKYEADGADGIFLYDYLSDGVYREQFLQTLNRVAKNKKIPLYAGCKTDCIAQAAEVFEAGADGIVFRMQTEPSDLLQKAVNRFGAEHVWVEADATPVATREGLKELCETIGKAKLYGIGGVLLKHVTLGPNVKELLSKSELPVAVRDSLVRNTAEELFELTGVCAVATNYYRDKHIGKAKEALLKSV